MPATPRASVVKVVGATPAPVVLHNPVILQTTSPILDDGFALKAGMKSKEFASGVGNRLPVPQRHPQRYFIGKF